MPQLLLHLDHIRAAVCLITGAHAAASLQTVHTALRNECWGGCNVEQSAMQLAHGGSVSQPMADTGTDGSHCAEVDLLSC